MVVKTKKLYRRKDGAHCQSSPVVVTKFASGPVLQGQDAALVSAFLELIAVAMASSILASTPSVTIASEAGAGWRSKLVAKKAIRILPTLETGEVDIDADVEAHLQALPLERWCASA